MPNFFFLISKRGITGVGGSSALNKSGDAFSTFLDYSFEESDTEPLSIISIFIKLLFFNYNILIIKLNFNVHLHFSK